MKIEIKFSITTYRPSLAIFLILLKPVINFEATVNSAVDGEYEISNEEIFTTSVVDEMLHAGHEFAKRPLMQKYKTFYWKHPISFMEHITIY